ncbi:hypothetical protein [Phycicoccus flavus]|uniref:hypothetical protein n=1 Tax=Phycicoccus flavus TaxID=2502783 RepID=UPI000FEBACBE|nr:hypothetical protein [Phycicoccus flavus]NHA68764.1 hypothetical protein [Phycicoccus flavus]
MQSNRIERNPSTVSIAGPADDDGGVEIPGIGVEADGVGSAVVGGGAVVVDRGGVGTGERVGSGGGLSQPQSTNSPDNIAEIIQRLTITFRLPQ